MFFFKYKNIPTLDIYFRDPLKDIISQSGSGASGKAIRRIGPHSFVANNRAIVIRYATASELRIIESLKPQRCYYLIDDDLGAVALDNSLPEDYRQRLMRFSRETLPEILSLSDTVVAPNPLIHRGYPDKRHLLLNPSYRTLCRNFEHFSRISTINILFSGTRSHQGDLWLIANVMADICRRFPEVHFTTFMGKHAPGPLRGIGNITNRKAMSWPAFRHVLQTEYYHIALAPCRDTPFNRARSVNKILDHAAFGAAGLYSGLGPITETVRHGQDALIVDDNHESWHNAITSLVKDTDTARQLARAGCKTAAKLGNPANVRDFWIRELFESSSHGD